MAVYICDMCNNIKDGDWIVAIPIKPHDFVCEDCVVDVADDLGLSDKEMDALYDY
mgnify:FL=1|tara:strand:+ start:1193 stop:1357 length:165 start_codon:yes stop_codon:yes gene_type:complete